MSLIATMLSPMVGPPIPPGIGQTNFFLQKGNPTIRPACYGNAAKLRGEQRRVTIMNLIDEVGEVTLTMVSGELEATINTARKHLDKLVAEGKLSVKAPDSRGTGKNIIWKLKIV